MFEGRPNCPKCNSIHVAPIQYGMPTEINTDAERLGEYVQAGCCIIIGVSPEWACLCCKHRGVQSDWQQGKLSEIKRANQP